jgi:hypothetical protein
MQGTVSYADQPSDVDAFQPSDEEDQDEVFGHWAYVAVEGSPKR